MDVPTDSSKDEDVDPVLDIEGIPDSVANAEDKEIKIHNGVIAEKSPAPSEVGQTVAQLPSNEDTGAILQPVSCDLGVEGGKDDIFDAILEKMAVTVPVLLKFITETEYDNNCTKCAEEQATSSTNEDTSFGGELFRLVSLPAFVNFLFETENTCPVNCSRKETVKRSCSTPNIKTQEPPQNPENICGDAKSESLEPVQPLFDEVSPKLEDEAGIIESQPLPITEEPLEFELDELYRDDETLVEEPVPESENDEPISDKEPEPQPILEEQPKLIVDEQPESSVTPLQLLVEEQEPELLIQEPEPETPVQEPEPEPLDQEPQPEPLVQEPEPEPFVEDPPKPFVEEPVPEPFVEEPPAPLVEEPSEPFVEEQDSELEELLSQIDADGKEFNVKEPEPEPDD